MKCACIGLKLTRKSEALVDQIEGFNFVGLIGGDDDDGLESVDSSSDGMKNRTPTDNLSLGLANPYTIGSPAQIAWGQRRQSNMIDKPPPSPHQDTINTDHQ
ncbi:hypothetical protein OIU85_006752 [Salix viminalis]|uniref:Uncharacterized protein n=1 Tax=Salix viminalis TaxID=40686 RepID=A0A9Q0PLT3_SALVM|nr:hypothetical protein OIU85_006752 [Salix viminalis]